MKYIISIVLFFALVLFAASVRADFSVADWRLVKAINLPEALGENEYVELELDQDVFAHAASGLRDLRIIENDSRREVPYQLVVEPREREGTTFPVNMRDLSYIKGEQTSFVFDLGRAGALHGEVEIITSSVNFRRSVSVEGGNDAASWAVLTEKGQIYDFTVFERGFRAQDTKVRYPESTVRYLRVTIFDRGEDALSLSGARVASVRETAAKEVQYDADIVARTQDPENQRTQIIFDLGGENLPSNRLELVVSDSNYSREVALEGSNDKNSWNSVYSRDILYSYDTPKFRGAKTSILYPETAFRYLRLTIFNADNPPLQIKSAHAVGLLRKVVFSVVPYAVLRLYYGNPLARYPSYDLAQYFRYLETEGLPAATLGLQEQNPLFEEKIPPPPPFSERFPWVLNGAVVVLTVGFGIFLVFLFRRIKNILPPK